jgi:hypothetical protein
MTNIDKQKVLDFLQYHIQKTQEQMTAVVQLKAEKKTWYTAYEINRAYDILREQIESGEFDA